MVELDLVRTYPAPRQLVWDAWTDPDQMALWWGPRGVSTPRESIELDLRPGGIVRFDMVDDATGNSLSQQRALRGGRPAGADRVDRRRLPRWLGQGDRHRHLPEAVDDATTRLRWRIVADFSETVRAGAEVGWGSQLDRLTGFLEGRRG